MEKKGYVRLFAFVKNVRCRCYLHNVWTLKVVWWENLQLQFVWNMPMIRTALRFILIVYKVGDDIRLAYVDQKAVADDYRSLQLGKCSITFSKISNFVLAV